MDVRALTPAAPGSSKSSALTSDGNSDSSDPYVREAQTFPRLSEEAARRVAQYGVEQGLRKGTLVFERGQRSVDFFLVLEGAIRLAKGKGLHRVAFCRPLGCQLSA